MQVRGRYLVIAWTAVFLAAVGAIVFRTRAGFLMQKRVTVINDSIRVLSALRGDIEADVAAQKSRPVLGPRMEQIGLRFASDTEFHIIHLPAHR